MSGRKRIFKSCHNDKLKPDHGPSFQSREFKVILRIKQCGIVVVMDKDRNRIGALSLARRYGVRARTTEVAELSQPMIPESAPVWMLFWAWEDRACVSAFRLLVTIN
jgi:hypothetical protein